MSRGTHEALHNRFAIGLLSRKALRKLILELLYGEARSCFESERVAISSEIQLKIYSPSEACAECIASDCIKPFEATGCAMLRIQLSFFALSLCGRVLLHHRAGRSDTTFRTPGQPPCRQLELMARPETQGSLRFITNLHANQAESHFDDFI